jgi:uncharacterized membrane protein
MAMEFTAGNLRPIRERIYQTLAYEAGGLVIATPLYALFFEQGTSASLLLMMALSVAVMTWTPLFNTAFDWMDLRLAGRIATERPQALRLAHAALLEASAVVVTLPLVMWFGGHDALTAIGINAGLTAVYAAYAYLFHLAYDQARPMAQSMPASLAYAAA